MMKRLLFPVLLTGLVLAACSAQHEPVARRTTSRRAVVAVKHVTGRRFVQHRVVESTRQLPLALVTEVAKARAQERPVPVPTCEGTYVSQHEDLTFDCPAGWYVWDDLTGSEEGLIVISNRPPLEPGGEGLTDGWFKVDLQIVPKADASSDQLPGRMCRTAVAGAATVSCAQVDIAGRSWIDRIARDDYTEYHGAATESNGWIYTANAIVPLGHSADEGRQIIESLYETLRVGDRL